MEETKMAEKLFQQSNVITGGKILILLFVAVFVWILLLGGLVALGIDKLSLSENLYFFIMIGLFLVQIDLLGYLARRFFNIK